MTRFCCTSDLHGHLPEIPDCDALLLAGDYCPTTKGQNWWLRDCFAPWLESIAARGIQIVGVAGNHDFIWEKRPDLVPRLPWTYLQDSETKICGFRIYGSPWQPRFMDWAFNLDEPELAQKWERIPNDAAILLLHGPPYQAGDYTTHKERIGSPSLRAKIELASPLLVVCGHNHGGFGHYKIGNTDVLNVALVDDHYRPVRRPVIWEI